MAELGSEGSQVAHPIGRVVPPAPPLAARVAAENPKRSRLGVLSFPLLARRSVIGCLPDRVPIRRLTVAFGDRYAGFIGPGGDLL
jgi:hypothetical protein